MQTPWGDLERLDLTDTVLAERILSGDKHQLVEGLIVESLFDQFVENIPNHVPSILPLDIETIIVDRGRDPDRWLAVVWARSKTEGLGRFLAALESRFTVFLIEFEPGVGFAGARIIDGKRAASRISLDELLRPFATTKHTPFKVDASVRDADRQRKAIWGFLLDRYGTGLASGVLLPRLLINCGVQPWFRAVWNLDRIFIADGVPWLFEVKHKFPFGPSPLKFGINNGELKVLGLLAECGSKVLFSIMVKPRWSKTISSLYMLNDLTARDRTAIVGLALDADRIARIMGRISGKSGADTTITGAGRGLAYKPIPVTNFGMCGVFSDKPASIAEKLVGEMRGIPSPRTTEQTLQSLRLPV